MSFNSVIPGLGITVAYSTTSGGTFTSVEQLKDFGGINIEVSMWDSTGLGSTAMEQVPTLIKVGPVTLKAIYDPDATTHAALLGYQLAKTLLYWKVTFPNPIGPDASNPSSPITATFAAYLGNSTSSGFTAESGSEIDWNLVVTGEATIA